jgi:hypothetical protein
LLHVTEESLSDDNDMTDMQAIWDVAAEVKQITAAGNSPEELAINRLAVCTERVLLTWGVKDQLAVKDWLIARAELLELQIPNA